MIQLGVLLFLKPINARIYSDSRIKNCDNPISENNQIKTSTEQKNRRKKHRRSKLKRGITGSGSITSSGSGDVVDKTNTRHLNDNNNEINGDDCCSDNESASEGPTTDDGEEGDEMQEVRNLLLVHFCCCLFEVLQILLFAIIRFYYDLTSSLNLKKRRHKFSGQKLHSQRSFGVCSKILDYYVPLSYNSINRQYLYLYFDHRRVVYFYCLGQLSVLINN